MKKILLGAMALLSLNGLAQNVNIPDANFKTALIQHGNIINPPFSNVSTIDTNGDGEIQVSEAQSYTGEIRVSSLNISDLTGLEAFTAATIIRCDNNNLMSLDVSSNTGLISLFCDNNSILSIDVSANPNIERLECQFNALVNLNVANGNNGNSSINDDFYYVDARNNPNLVCIQRDPTFTPNPSTSYWYKDAGASWSDVPCPCPSVNIPDANFKAYLVGNSSINTDGDSEICVSEAQAYTGNIFINNLNIADLTGIEAFTNLNELNSAANPLTSLDVSQNTALTRLVFTNSTVSSLDVSQNTALTELLCPNNQIQSLDVSSLTNLTTLWCNNNGLTTLNTANCPSLTQIECENNSLTELDVSTNTSLTSLKCNYNQLTSLNVANGNNSNVYLMNATNNPNLTCIQHDTGFDPTQAFQWDKDATASWSDNCGPILVSSITVQGQGGATSITTAGGTLQMEAAVLPSDADDMTCTWSVTNGTGSATIDANGLLTAATDGTVDVIATANDGSGVTGSTTITISNQTASINENSIAFSIVPNPTSGMVKIDSDIAIKSVEIYATSGQKVASFETKEFDLSELENGVYFIKVLGYKGSITSRIIKE